MTDPNQNANPTASADETPLADDSATLDEVDGGWRLLPYYRIESRIGPNPEVSAPVSGADGVSHRAI